MLVHRDLSFLTQYIGRHYVLADDRKCSISHRKALFFNINSVSMSELYNLKTFVFLFLVKRLQKVIVFLVAKHDFETTTYYRLQNRCYNCD